MIINRTEQLGAILFAVIMVTSMFVAGIALMGAPVAADTTDEPLEPGADINQSNVPATIEKPGTYHITEDIDLGGQAIAALEIKSSNVTIVGNNHTISNGTSEAIHILASGSNNALENVTITNLEITNTETAISAMNVEDSSFTDLRLVSNNDAGLVFAGNAGQNNLVDNVRLEENEKGIFMREGTSGMTIRNSDFIANHEVAIKASGSSDHLIQNNYFAGQDGEKVIHLTGRSPGTEIRNNKITGSDGPEYVIQVGGESTNTIVADNLLYDNSLGGISIGPLNGEVRNNTISGHGDPAISVEGDNSVVAENTVTGNVYGLYLLGTGITGADNTVKNNAEWDVYAAEGATNNVLTDLVIDDAGTTVTVTGDAVDFALKGTEAPSPDAPTNYDSIGTYVDVTTTSEAGVVGLEISYDQQALTVDEVNLTVAVFDGTEWKGIVDAGVEKSHNFVYVNAHVEGILGAVAGTDDIIDPVADAGADTTELANTSVTFDASASYDPGDGASGITEYAWDFDGDDTDDYTGSDAVTNYTYDEAGTYVATLTVTDGNGNTDTDTRVVTVLGEDTEPPVADAGPDHYGLIGATFDFDASGSTDNVGIESYEWDLNGDGTVDDTGDQVSGTYLTPGEYVVTLKVTDTAGNVGIDTANVTIIESDTTDPVADAGEDRTVEVATSVTFDGSGSTDDIGIENYTWDFGDGSGTVTGETVTHTYSTEGTDVLTLTVEDAAGNTDTDTATITVAEHVDEEVLQPGEISTCGVIETPGVYTLTEDLYASAEGVTTCFEVKSGGVTLDGNGHTVSGDVVDAAEGIHVLGTTSALENVVIKDLTLTQWDSAISAKNVKDSTFENIDFVSNLDKGLAISGDTSTNNVVTDSTFTDNEKGIFLERGADHTRIQDNTFLANHEVGVKASGAPDTEVLNNVFTGHDGEKVIHFTGESPRATIQGNRVLDSTGPENAIQIGGESGDSLVADNIVAGGTLGGISAGPYNVDIVNNTVYDNGDIGITVGDGDGGVHDNLVYDNRIGIAFDASSGVTATNNVVKNNNEEDIVALDGATNNVVTGLVIDDNETTIDVGLSSIDYAIEGSVEGPTGVPYDYTAQGEDFDVNITSDVGKLDLTVYYNDDVVTGTTEDQLTLARYNATSETWTGLPTVLDTDADTMQASITEAGIIAPLSGSLGEATADKLVVEPNEDVNFSVTPVDENFTYAWDVDGDGTTDYTGPNATHRYTEGGIYDAVLTISTTDTGFSDALTVQVGVDTESPVADAGPDRYVQPTVTFDGTNSTDDMDELDALETGIETFEWEFGDGANATGAVVSHTYADDGAYTATLTVTDYVGHTDNDTVTVTVDSVPPNPNAGNQYRYGKINQEISFDASASTDNVGIDRYEWSFGDGTSGTDVTTSTTYDTAGTYTVTLTIVDLAGNEASTNVQVTIEDDDDDSSGGADDGNDGTDDGSAGSPGSGSPTAGGGGSSGSSGGSDDGTSSGPNVEVNYGNGTQAQVSVGNQGMNDTVRVQFQFQNDDTCVALEQLQFRARQTEEFQFRVNQSTDAPQGAVWQSRTGSQAFGYLSVDHDGEIDDGKFTFRVRTDCLQNGNANAEHLRLYRHNGTEWEQLQTRVLNQTQEQVRYEADAPNFSAFAVGVAESDISVVDASLVEDRIQTGEDATVEVTLTNEGDLDGSFEVQLESQGTIVQTKMVTVPAGEPVTNTLVEIFDTAGEYDLTVNGVTAGTLVVESGEEPAIGTTEPAPAPDEGDGGLSLRVLSLALLGLLAMLLGAYVLSRRRIAK